MSETKKPLTKMEWFKQELAKDDYFPSELCIIRILDGNPSEYVETALIDYVEELDREWKAKHTS